MRSRGYITLARIEASERPTVDLMASTLAKLARADKHLATFNREADAWGESDPFVIARESHGEGREHIFRVKYRCPRR